jgi:N-acetyl sugar amidotransferase
MFGLPKKVEFCSKCTLSNQRPVPVAEFKSKKISEKKGNTIDNNSICNACKFAELKNKINWKDREKELLKLCDQFRSKNNKEYDCVVPGSGGKDSRYASYILKEKYGMNPLTVTWAPHIYTDIGWKNMISWTNQVDNYLITPNRNVQRKLSREAFLNLLHPFQPFVFGQRFAAIRVAMNMNIKLIFHGESPFEYGLNKLSDANASGFDPKYFCGSQEANEVYLGGVSAKKLIVKHNFRPSDLLHYFPIDTKDLKKKKFVYKFLGYYIKWNPQEIFYFVSKNTGFIPNPERTEGTYSKYASLDDKIDGFHYYTSYIKFGLGRATMDTAQEIRNGLLNREEGISLVKKYDGEFPKKYFEEILDYLDLSEKQFWITINKFRSSHLWTKKNSNWKLKKTIYD